MSSIINKRQQARNERILQDLLKSVVGNDRCADCGTKNPVWASWSLGIFLCIRCASLHRKLGTHISKVKSISMDAWTNDQIDNMRTNGNAKSNTYYNPDPSKHPVPLSIEDSVGVLERYIRNKYEYQLFRRGVDAPQTSSTSSVSSGASSSFGATANSGISLPSSSSSNASFNPGQRSVSAGYTSSRLGSISASPGQNKASQVLGVNTYADGGAPIIQFPHGMVQASPTVKYEDQIKALRDMGFKDDNQILQVLILTEGKILESVDHLVRLNGGNHPRPPTSNGGGAGIMIQKPDGNRDPFEALDRELPPLPPGAVEVGGLSPGLRPTIYSTRDQPIQQQQLPQSAPSTSYGTDGVDGWFQVPQQLQPQQLQPQQLQPQQLQMQSTGYQQQGMGYQVSGHKTGPQLGTANPYYGGGGGAGMFTTVAPMNGVGSYNPFMSNSVPPGHNPYTPPSAQQQQNHQAHLQQQQQIQQQQQLQQQQHHQQQMQQQAQLQQQQIQQQQLQQQQVQQQQLQAQQLQQQQLQAQQLQAQQLQAQQLQAQQLQAQQQALQQQHYLQSQLQPQQHLPLQTMYTGAPANPYQLPLAAPQPNPYQSQLLQQRTGGVDKSAILALFNYPHLAPPPNSNPINLVQQENNLPVPGHMERSMSAPSAGSNNPFLPPMQGLPMSQSSLNLAGQAGQGGVRGGSVAGQGGRGHMSQESVDFGAWQTGRHSPDAFASLSFGQ